MNIIDKVIHAQVWVTSVFLVLVCAAFVMVRGQRRALGVHVGLFLLALTFRLFGRAFEAAEMLNVAAVLQACGAALQGMVLISLVGMFLFSGLLPIFGAGVPRILQDVTVFVGLVVWLFIVLEAQGVNLAGIIATSAVLTAVIGLALQDTLGNILAGLAVQLDKSIGVGDWVKIDDIAGRVSETRWRYTAIETRNWETVLIPNSLISKTKVVVQGRRHDAPVQWRRWIWFNVDFRYSPSVVVETVETAVQAAEIPRVARSPAPSCVAMEFFDSYTRYALRYWLTDLEADDPTDSEVRAHIYSALQRAGMSLAIPGHAVFLTEETTQRKAQKEKQELKNRVAALRKIRLFEPLTDDDLLHLAERLVYAPFDRGDVMTQQGAEAHWLYLMIDGTAERLVEEDGKSTRVGELGSGDTFGEWSIMLNTIRETTVVATSKVSCYRLPKEAFVSVLAGHPELTEQIAEIIARQRTQLEVAHQHLDEEARKQRHEDNHSRVLESLRQWFRGTHE